MIDVNKLKKFIDYISNKEQAGNSIKPTEYNDLLPRAVDDLFKWRYGLPEQYTPGMPLPAVTYEVTQKIKDDLRNLKETEYISIDSDGFADIPEDYVHKTSLSYRRVHNVKGGNPDVKYIPIEIVEDNVFENRVTSVIKKPDLDRPIAVFHSDTIEIVPRHLQKLKLVYLRYPKEPKWAYTINNSDVAVYDPSNSVHIELPQNLLNDIARLMLSYMGINLRESSLSQYAQQQKQLGY